MGINISVSKVDLSDNDYLNQFVGKTHIPPSNWEFWKNLLEYNVNIPKNSEEQLALDSKLETLCETFIANNLKSGNFGSLIKVFFRLSEELLSLAGTAAESAIHIWRTFNALFIIRSITKYLIETCSEYQLLQHFEANPVEEDAKEDNAGEVAINVSGEEIPVGIKSKVVDGSRFEAFFESLVNTIVVIPVKEYTYHLHLEAVNTIIVMLSVHLFSQEPVEKSTIFRTIYRCPYANTLMSTLLHFVCRMSQVPSTMFGGHTAGGSVVFGIAESLWSMLTFSKKAPDILTAEDIPKAFREYFPLANQSLLLILILTNHNTATDNSYRSSLFRCSDASELARDDTESFKIDFSSLYNTLCRIVNIDQTILLLYLLLHRNERFYKFVMAQENLQQLVVPILQTLYHAPDSTSHNIYMSLILLLILSEDEGFNKSVHSIMLKNISWYTERSISEISLGGLLILVVIRTIQYNIVRMRDKYLHTNCLAALANMSGQFRYLHPYVSQRLVSLFETLAKKHARLDAQLQQPVANGTSADIAVNVLTNTEDMLQDLGVLEEVLRMVLEILNSCLSHQLVYCPNLVYTLLYKREIFSNFRSHVSFQDIIQNIDMVVGFFSSRLQRVQDQRGELGVSEVLEVISKGASQWSSDRLRKFPDLKFKYVEEDSPEQFFVPYVWSIITSNNGSVHFNSESIKQATDVAC